MVVEEMKEVAGEVLKNSEAGMKEVEEAVVAAMADD